LSSQEEEEKGEEPEESKVTIQHPDSEEEGANTIHKNKPVDSSIKSTLITQPDSDLHEFSYDGRKFFVRLN
jgi:hypothetical protein